MASRYVEKQMARFNEKRISFFLKRENKNWDMELLTDRSYDSVEDARTAGATMVKGTDLCCVIVEQVLQYGDRRLADVEVVQDWDRC